jgi:hypothetical protein
MLQSVAMQQHELRMRRSKGFVLALALLTCPPATAQSQDFGFRDIREILGSNNRVREAFGSPPVVRETQQTFAADNAPASPDASLDRPSLS